jgi:hypothetical protein
MASVGKKDDMIGQITGQFLGCDARKKNELGRRERRGDGEIT